MQLMNRELPFGGHGYVINEGMQGIGCRGKYSFEDGQMGDWQSCFCASKACSDMLNDHCLSYLMPESNGIGFKWIHRTSEMNPDNFWNHFVSGVSGGTGIILHNFCKEIKSKFYLSVWIKIWINKKHLQNHGLNALNVEGWDARIRGYKVKQGNNFYLYRPPKKYSTPQFFTG